MSGIAGFCEHKKDFMADCGLWNNVLKDMLEAIAHRGGVRAVEYNKGSLKPWAWSAAKRQRAFCVLSDNGHGLKWPLLYLRENVGMAQTGLPAMNPAGGGRPVIQNANGAEYAIVCDGLLCNGKELKQELGPVMRDGNSDCADADAAGIILRAYIRFGLDFVKRLNRLLTKLPNEKT